MPRPAWASLAPYALAAIAVVLADLVRASLVSVLGNRFVFLTYFPTIAILAALAGPGPTLFGVALSAAWMVAVLMDFTQRADLAAFAVFLLSGLVLSALSGQASRSRRQAERRRDEADREREGWRTTLASVGDAVIVTDPRGTVTFLNSVAESLTGWHLAEAAGRPLEEVFVIVREGDRRPADDPVRRVIETGKVQGLADHTILIARDRTERCIDDSAAPIRGPGGLSGVILVFRDVTERRKAEVALRESEQRFRHLADSAPMLVWMSGPDRMRTYFNRAWLDFTGRPAEEELGDRWVEGVHPDDLDRCLHAYNHAFETLGDFHVEYRLRRHDGEYRWLLGHGVPRYDETGTFLGYIACCMDITPRREAEEALREADRRKDEFLATLAHELRNPLAPIRNALQIMRLAKNDLNVLHNSRDMIERQVRQMVRLVDDLLDVSRITRGKLELRKERLEIAAAVAAAVETSRPLIEAARHELTVTVPPGLLAVEGDLARLSQVLSNLLNNAAKYTPPGGRITLSAGREGGEVVLRVRDTGEGFRPEVLARLFEPFTQGESASGRMHGGLGIGLALSRRLTELHGGRLEGHSEGPGRGSEFVVRLPLLSNCPPAAPARPPTPAGKGSRRVLVVDDNVDSAESLAALMAALGHETRVCHDGPGALIAAAEMRPDLVLLDLGLPGMSGLEVAPRLRAITGLERVVIVAQTGWGQEADRRRSREAGIDRHLVKPVSPEALAEALAQLPPGGKGDS